MHPTSTINPVQTDDETKLRTGLMRVVRHVRWFWELHKQPLRLRSLQRYFRMGSNNLADHIDVPPLSEQVIPLVNRYGGVYLMPREAWDTMRYEDQRELKAQLLKGPANYVKKTPKVPHGAPKPVVEPNDFSELLTRDLRDFEA